jgi:hypothetical protein
MPHPTPRTSAPVAHFLQHLGLLQLVSTVSEHLFWRNGGRRVAVVELLLAVLAVQSCPCARADHAAAAGSGALQYEGGMLLPLLLQQEGEVFAALPRNLLILFITLSFMIPILKYVFRLLKAQFDLFMAAAAQDADDEEMLE